MFSCGRGISDSTPCWGKQVRGHHEGSERAKNCIASRSAERSRRGSALLGGSEDCE